MHLQQSDLWTPFDLSVLCLLWQWAATEVICAYHSCPPPPPPYIVQQRDCRIILECCPLFFFLQTGFWFLSLLLATNANMNNRLQTQHDWVRARLMGSDEQPSCIKTRLGVNQSDTGPSWLHRLKYCRIPLMCNADQLRLCFIYIFIKGCYFLMLLPFLCELYWWIILA